MICILITNMNRTPATAFPSVGIIADDLTSAADGAGPFLPWGGSARVRRDAMDDEGARVLSRDTGSRAMPEAAAAQAAGQATAALARRDVVYKTMDSTLRGHVRAELAGAFRASGRQLLVVAPAFPDAGRVTSGGHQYVNGTLVAASAYGADPVHPARTSRILDLIDPAIGPVREVAEGASAVALREAAATSRGLVLDARTQQGLNARVAQVAALGVPVLWVGAPGMARALAAHYGTTPSTRPTHCEAAPVRRVLVVVGSANPVSHAQCDALREAGTQVVAQADEIHPAAPLVCLRAPQAAQAGPAAVLAALTQQAARALACHAFDALIATGGDTLAALLDALGIRAFTLTDELAPGFPAGMALRADNGQPLAIAMKAGGFGGPDALFDAAERLLRR
ncbi:3-oxo-tetronate kinase [Achromobacter deleyi]|uniref:3-oxo-tetronate kinase n=2 Tax=Achromobacter deleyi TaxID=1353891 RepID=A0A6S7ATB2_9BURK|nr:3-oxo-tetronate kinase [Achromobacter deleyi]CAB3910102.1 3-oxo-tetronate kinase [Achromobacter deleyi]CAB3928001.1 3-oxo-tetronate kinase [Achromobacter deleyi]